LYLFGLFILLIFGRFSLTIICQGDKKDEWGTVRRGKAWQGSARFGMVWQGKVWYGKAVV
jgi:hypothetical protein